jgi:hypothetical protein
VAVEEVAAQHRRASTARMEAGARLRRAEVGVGVEVRRRRALGAQAVAGARLQQAEAVGLGSPQHQASEARAEVEAQHQQAAVEEAQHQRAWVEEAVAGRHHQAAEAAVEEAQH